jgi:hypothetical protein
MAETPKTPTGFAVAESDAGLVLDRGAQEALALLQLHLILLAATFLSPVHLRGQGKRHLG